MQGIFIILWKNGEGIPERNETVEEKEREDQKLNPFDMLEELLWQDQFELILQESGKREKERIEETETEKKDSGKEENDSGADIRLVYLMNDAVESFLVFVNARMTGQYQPDYEGELEAELRQEEKEYVLVVRQGDSVVTIFFEELKAEIHLYRYGDLGHFWVSGYENLRQLEYRIAILHTKCEYLGTDAASEEECRLAELVHFPPLNYACYPAVPDKYIVPMEDVWTPTQEAIQIMEELAEDADDTVLLWWLKFYRNHHGKRMSRLLAWMLHRTQHAGVVDLLTEKLMEESRRYPVRSYHVDENTEKYYQEVLAEAEKRKKELESGGAQVTLVREEPFTTAQDSVEYKVHLMIWKTRWGNRIIKVIDF